MSQNETDNIASQQMSQVHEYSNPAIIKVENTTPPYDTYIDNVLNIDNIFHINNIIDREKYFIIPASVSISKKYRYYVRNAATKEEIDDKKNNSTDDIVPIIYVSNINTPYLCIGSYNMDIYNKHKRLYIDDIECKIKYSRCMHQIDYVAHFGILPVVQDENNIGRILNAKLYIRSKLVMSSPFIIVKIVAPIRRNII